ncbi:MAG TPA: hypothetical protein VGP71_15695 [Burkholderiales bacterium]|jgi:hypothetical protein|nr:hypothetical protein [Burkholderiales bacterium]
MSDRKAIGAHENKRSLALEWFMVLVWVAVCVAASAVLYQRGTSNVPLWVLIVLGVMSLFGVLLLWGLTNRTIGMAKFGAIGLEILAPATIGGRLAAAIKLPPAARGASVLGAELACLHVRWQKTNDRESSNRIEKDLHRERREFPIQWAGDHGQVHLQFAIPSGLPHSDANEQDDEEDPAKGFHFWQLKIDASVAGVDLMRTYPVQVAPARAAAPLA